MQKYGRHMPIKRNNNHLHLYRRVKLSKNYTVLKCQEPLCTHYISLKLAEGKMCRCNRCRQPMLLTRAALDLARPHCDLCTKSKKVDLVALSQKLKELGID